MQTMDIQRLILLRDLLLLRVLPVVGVAAGVRPAAAAAGCANDNACARTTRSSGQGPARSVDRTRAGGDHGCRGVPMPDRRPGGDRGPEDHDQDRPLHGRGRHAGRRDLARVAAKHQDATDPTKPYLALQRTTDRTFVAQAGLIGEGMPNHRTQYEGGARAARARSRQRSASSCKLNATTPTGDKVVQVLTFHRGSYLIDAAFDVTNARAAPVSPYAYFQLTRDTKQAVVQKLDGAGGVRRAGRLQRQGQLQEGRIRRHRQADRRAQPQADLHQDGGQRLDRHDRALLRRRVASVRREEDAARVLYAQARRRAVLGRRDRAGRHHRARAPRAKCACRCTSARRTRTCSPRPRRASTSSSTTASSPCSPRRCSCSCKWLHGLIGNWGWAIVRDDDHDQGARSTRSTRRPRARWAR